jgi:hypothetical protein
LVYKKGFSGWLKGAITLTYPGLFLGGIDKSAAKPILDGMIATFPAGCSSEKYLR